MKFKNYINIANGIELLEMHQTIPFNFVRIQSTACEQKRWDSIIQDLDTGFIMDAITGKRISVFDASHRNRVPRAMWQGLEWIKYVLNIHMLGNNYKPMCRGSNVSKYFSECYNKLDRRTIAKLDYLKKFCIVNELHIQYCTWVTKHDGDYEYYKSILRDNMEA